MSKEFSLGLIDTPPPVHAVDVTPALGGAVDLPENFIVPMFRHWFDAQWNPVPEKVNTLPSGESAERNQQWLDRCVGEGFALQKSSHEGVFISAKDTWAITKEIDEKSGHPKSAFGATAWSGAEAIKRGAASEKTIPSNVTGTRDENMDQAWVNDQVKQEREVFSGSTPYFVPRNEILKTLFVTTHPVTTSCQWHTRDNDIGRNGNSPMMTFPEGDNVGGHMFAIIGWIKFNGVRCRVVANSWGKNWGWHGMFLIPDDVEGRLGNGYVHVDKKQETLMELLARYDGKNVKRLGKPDHYRCELGVLRKYPDEIVWWAHGNVFGWNVYDIPDDHFNVIPKGDPMKIEDGKNRELVRQIRQFYGKN